MVAFTNSLGHLDVARRGLSRCLVTTLLSLSTVALPEYEGLVVHVLPEHGPVLCPALLPEQALQGGDQVPGGGSVPRHRLPAPQHDLPVHGVPVLNQVRVLRSLQPLTIQDLELCLLIRLLKFKKVKIE